MSRILEYIEYLRNTHKSCRAILIQNGKTYRSYKVAFENGYLSALTDVKDAIERPERNRQVEEAMKRFGESQKG